MGAQNMLHTEWKQCFFLNNFQMCDCSCFEQISWTEQITDFASHLRTYFWVATDIIAMDNIT